MAGLRSAHREATPHGLLDAQAASKPLRLKSHLEEASSSQRRGLSHLVTNSHPTPSALVGLAEIHEGPG